MEELREIELTCLSLIDYNLLYINPMIYLELLFINGIVFTTDNIKPEESNFVYKTSLIVLEEIMKINNCYIQYNPFYISCSVIAFSRKKFNLEEWPNFLGKIFHISFDDFKSTLDFLNESLKDFKIHDKYFKDRNNSIEKYNQNIYKDNSCIMKKTYKKIKAKEEGKDKKERQNSSAINYYQNKYEQYKRLNENNSLEKSINYKCLGNNSSSIIYNEKNINNHCFWNKESSQNKIQIKTIYHKENSKNEDNTFLYLHKNLFKNNKRYIKDSISINYNNSEINDNNNEFKKNSDLKKNKLCCSQEIINSHNDFEKEYDINNLNNQKKEKGKISSIEHYKKFNISLNYKYPLSARKVKNLSVVINHLYSNHNNNIL